MSFHSDCIVLVKNNNHYNKKSICIFTTASDNCENISCNCSDGNKQITVGVTFHLITTVMNCVCVCVEAKGVGERASSGLFSSIAQQAAQLHPDSKTSPVVCLETDQR